MPSFRTRHHMPFTPSQMFALVAEVERYPEFLPLCEALVVRSRSREGEAQVLIADMTVGYAAIRETFTSKVTLDPVGLTVRAQGTKDSPGPFSRLDNRWEFRASSSGGCEVDFAIAYDFKSMLLQMLVGAVFERAFRRYTRAFEERAQTIYGAEPSAARATS